MPIAVKRAIAVVEGAKMVDQRAEAVVRRGAQFNRIADSHRIVVYRLRAGMGGANHILDRPVCSRKSRAMISMAHLATTLPPRLLVT